MAKILLVQVSKMMSSATYSYPHDHLQSALRIRINLSLCQDYTIETLYSLSSSAFNIIKMNEI